MDGRVMTGFMQVINRVVRWLFNVPPMTPGVLLTFLKLVINCTIQEVSFSDYRNEGILLRLGTMTKKWWQSALKTMGRNQTPYCGCCEHQFLTMLMWCHLSDVWTNFLKYAIYCASMRWNQFMLLVLLFSYYCEESSSVKHQWNLCFRKVSKRKPLRECNEVNAVNIPLSASWQAHSPVLMSYPFSLAFTWYPFSFL